MSEIVNTQEEAWLAAINAPGAVLAKFSAPWCGPCKAMEPHLQRLESEPGMPTVVRIDVEEAPELASRYGVRAMPTTILFRDGLRVASVVGLQSYAQLVNFVAESS